MQWEWRHLMGLIVLRLDAFDLHLPEHCGPQLVFAQVAVVDDTWMFRKNKKQQRRHFPFSAIYATTH